VDTFTARVSLLRVAKSAVTHSGIPPGNRRTVGRSWCAWLPATSARWSLVRSRMTGHSRCQGMNSRIPPHRVAPGRNLRHLESRSRRRETAPGWRKPSCWLSEKPANVSIAGGNAVTATVLVATANQHGCHRLRETTSPQDPHSQWGNVRGGGRREGTTPGKVWTTF
jgi:hypothetical protein